MASISYIFYLIAVARGEVLFNNIFSKTLEMFASISMSWFVIFCVQICSDHYIFSHGHDRGK